MCHIIGCAFEIVSVVVRPRVLFRFFVNVCFSLIVSRFFQCENALEARQDLGFLLYCFVEPLGAVKRVDELFFSSLASCFEAAIFVTSDACASTPRLLPP